jgi:chorismate mutase
MFIRAIWFSTVPLRRPRAILHALQHLIALGCCALLLSACAGLRPGSVDAQTQADLRQLLELQKQRLDVATPVARSKWNSGAAIDDPAREATILNEVAAQAQKIGVDPQWSRRFFQDQFDAGKIVQRELHAQWRAQGLPPFAAPPDLAREVRPVLDKLTPALLQSLLRLQGRWCETGMRAELAALSSRILAPDYDRAVRERALASLLCPD